MKALKLVISISTAVIVGTSLLAASPSYGARLGGGNPPSVARKVKLQHPPKFHPNKPYSKPKGNSQAVPEPASVLGIMAFGALGGSRLLKRRRTGAA